MSAFSRGQVFWQECHLQFSRRICLPTPQAHYRPRFFSSGCVLRTVKHTRSSPASNSTISKVKPSYTPTKSTPRTIPTYQSYASTLAQKSHPTLIYQAPSHGLYKVLCYSASTFCFTYASINSWAHYLSPPESLPLWVQYAYGGIAIMMASIGTYFVLSPARLIRSITAVPKHLSKNLLINAAKSANPELLVQVQLKKMFPIPFFPARVLSVKPDEVLLRAPLAAPTPRKMSADEMMRMRLEKERLRKQEMEYERSHIMTAPFRHMSQALFKLYQELGRVWTREGFLKVYVKGTPYKLDVRGGWLLDEGKALDRLGMIKPQ